MTAPIGSRTAVIVSRAQARAESGPRFEFVAEFTRIRALETRRRSLATSATHAPLMPLFQHHVGGPIEKSDGQQDEQCRGAERQKRRQMQPSEQLLARLVED